MPRHVRKILIPGQLLLADPDSFELTLFSPNFPPVPDGYPIPRIEPTFHKATPPGPA
jgi:hypothetical protein